MSSRTARDRSSMTRPSPGCARGKHSRRFRDGGDGYREAERPEGRSMHTARAARLPDAEALRHRGRRRVEFVIGGAVVGAMIGIVGFVVVIIGGGHRWGTTAVAIVALAVAGAIGG